MHLTPQPPDPKMSVFSEVHALDLCIVGSNSFAFQFPRTPENWRYGHKATLMDLVTGGQDDITTGTASISSIVE